MHSIQLLTFITLSLSTFGSAYELANHNKDGFYLTSRDLETGNATHEYLGADFEDVEAPEDNLGAPTVFSRLFRRETWTTTDHGCSGKYANRFEVIGSLRPPFAKLLDSGIKVNAGNHIAYHRNNLVVYMCIIQDDQTSSSGELAAALSSLDSLCPDSNNVASGGYAYNKNWKKTFGIGRPGDVVCKQTGTI